MRQRITPLFVAALLLGSFVLGAEPERASDIVIVVNKSSGLQTLSADELRNIYLGEKSVWPDGRKVLPAAFGAGTPELRSFLKSVCRMSEGDYKRYFIQMIFEGKPVVQPRILNSSAAVRAFVSASPGGIGIIRSSEVDSSVAVVKLDAGSRKSAGKRSPE